MTMVMKMIMRILILMTKYWNDNAESEIKTSSSVFLRHRLRQSSGHQQGNLPGQQQHHHHRRRHLRYQHDHFHQAKVNLLGHEHHCCPHRHLHYQHDHCYHLNLAEILADFDRNCWHFSDHWILEQENSSLSNAWLWGEDSQIFHPPCSSLGIFILTLLSHFSYQ